MTAALIRTSRAAQPVAVASNGLISISSTSGKSRSNRETVTTTRATASTSTAATLRKPRILLYTRVRAMSCRARRSSIGGSSRAVSSMASTAVPPSPNSTTGPKSPPVVAPTMSSRPVPRSNIRSTVKPRTHVPGCDSVTRASIAAAAFSTARPPRRFSTTPPTSDLCTISAAASFSATLPPSRSAASPASCGVVASATGVVGMPYAVSTARASDCVSHSTRGCARRLERRPRGGRRNRRRHRLRLEIDQAGSALAMLHQLHEPLDSLFGRSVGRDAGVLQQRAPSTS